MSQRIDLTGQSFGKLKRGPGQPRKYKSNAEKQAAYRRRKEENEREKLIDYLAGSAEAARRLSALTTRELREQERAVRTQNWQREEEYRNKSLRRKNIVTPS